MNKELKRKSLIGTLIRVLTCLTLLGLLYKPASASAAGAAPLNNVKLTWNRSTSSDVVGYRIYYGIASGSYTNSIVVGNVTNYTLSNLVNGVTYFFASKAYTAGNIESPYSNEALFVPGGGAILQLTVAANKEATLTVVGKSSHTYEVQTSSNLKSWSLLGTVTLGSNGTAIFTDAGAKYYSNRYYRTRDIAP